MQNSYKPYNYIDSISRIDEILDTSDTSFEELQSIPPREKLTYTNGFYVYCSAIMIDIRGSSKLTDQHYRPTLAKIYRSYISEMVAIVNGNPRCAEINIIGDGVLSIFNTPYKEDIDTIFSTAAEAASIVNILNYKLQKRKITEIKVGIGMDYGRALMIKAGYKGSGINDVVWMGDVVNQASKLCGHGNKEYYDRQMMVSSVFYSNLNEDNQKLLAWNSYRNCYHGNVINVSMDSWLEQSKSLSY